jgi:ABC-type uncharacterized transport system substrate-binding protein
MRLPFRLWPLIALCLALATWWLAGSARAQPTVAVVLSEPGGIHLAAAEALTAELAGRSTHWEARLYQASEPVSEPVDLIVAIGVRALRQLLRAPGDTPVLALLVPRSTYASLLREAGPSRRPVSAIYLEQSYTRQLRLLRQALPGSRRVGVLLGPASAAEAEALQSATHGPQQLEIRHIDGAGDLFPALDELAGKVDALLLLPDAAVVGRATLPSLLLQTYRRRLPVMGYSEALSQAGALLSLYTTPAQIGAEAGQLIRDLPPGPARLPAPRYPRGFSLRVNDSVARSLGINLPGIASLRAMVMGDGQ